jgi:hypothetical protein
MLGAGKEQQRRRAECQVDQHAEKLSETPDPAFTTQKIRDADGSKRGGDKQGE